MKYERYQTPNIPRAPSRLLSLTKHECLFHTEIEAEMARTQKNKATNYHLGTLKAKLAKLRNELLVEQSGAGGGGGEGGFDVARLGDARVALIGFPSVGKSTLLSALTPTESETVRLLIVVEVYSGVVLVLSCFGRLIYSLSYPFQHSPGCL